jgi:hypothetical protein
MPDDFITKDLTCRLCGKQFNSLVVRKSAQPVLKTDSDFCIHYERETPYFYNVFVCPACGYAFLESFEKKPGTKMREKLTPLPDFFSDKRDAPTAQLAYKRAIECAKMQKESDMVLASLYLQLSWIMRVKGDEKAEKEAQGEALAYYKGVYEESDLEDASRVMYLIGELNRRLGYLKEAVYWYSRVANDKNSNQATRRMARDAWQSLRD